MSFLSPWFLYGFAALAVPIVIHLWQRKKVIKVPFRILWLRIERMTVSP